MILNSPELQSTFLISRQWNITQTILKFFQNKRVSLEIRKPWQTFNILDTGHKMIKIFWSFSTWNGFVLGVGSWVQISCSRQLSNSLVLFAFGNSANRGGVVSGRRLLPRNKNKLDSFTFLGQRGCEYSYTCPFLPPDLKISSRNFFNSRDTGI